MRARGWPATKASTLARTAAGISAASQALLAHAPRYSSTIHTSVGDVAGAASGAAIASDAERQKPASAGSIIAGNVARGALSRDPTKSYRGVESMPHTFALPGMPISPARLDKSRLFTYATSAALTAALVAASPQ